MPEPVARTAVGQNETQPLDELKGSASDTELIVRPKLPPRLATIVESGNHTGIATQEPPDLFRCLAQQIHAEVGDAELRIRPMYSAPLCATELNTVFRQPVSGSTGKFAPTRSRSSTLCRSHGRPQSR